MLILYVFWVSIGLRCHHIVRSCHCVVLCVSVIVEVVKFFPNAWRRIWIKDLYSLCSNIFFSFFFVRLFLLLLSFVKEAKTPITIIVQTLSLMKLFVLVYVYVQKKIIVKLEDNASFTDFVSKQILSYI